MRLDADTTVKWFKSEADRRAYLRQTIDEDYPVKPVEKPTKRRKKREDVSPDTGDNNAATD